MTPVEAGGDEVDRDEVDERVEEADELELGLDLVDRRFRLNLLKSIDIVLLVASFCF